MSQQPMAYLSPDFLDSDEARPIRILSEYLEPLRRFKEQKIQDTVVFFGSARVDSRERAARELARLLTDWSMTLQSENHRFVVASGGGPGIMEAPTAARARRAARRSG